MWPAFCPQQALEGEVLACCPRFLPPGQVAPWQRPQRPPSSGRDCCSPQATRLRSRSRLPVSSGPWQGARVEPTLSSHRVCSQEPPPTCTRAPRAAHLPTRPSSQSPSFLGVGGPAGPGVQPTVSVSRLGAQTRGPPPDASCNSRPSPGRCRPSVPELERLCPQEPLQPLCPAPPLLLPIGLSLRRPGPRPTGAPLTSRRPGPAAAAPAGISGAHPASCVVLQARPRQGGQWFGDSGPRRAFVQPPSLGLTPRAHEEHTEKPKKQIISLKMVGRHE